MYSVDTVIGPPGSLPKERGQGQFRWPEEGVSAVPDWVYTSPEIYEREVERIFHGPTWNFVALAAELPNPGDFKRSYVGPTPVVVARDADGSVHVFENRCVHRGVEFCRRSLGNAQEFVCPYHQWSYDLRGNLRSVPFRRGLKNEMGMPDDFRLEDHGLRKLKVAVLHGVVFASFAEEMPPIEQYLGAEMLKEFEAVFKDRPLRILGYYRNELPGNWKLYHENLKDPYHGTLLHVYLVNFGLFAAGNRFRMIVDETGRHAIAASARGSVAQSLDAESQREMRVYRDDMKLNDERFLSYTREFDSPWTVAMHTIWPNLIVQRELNTLGIRHIIPNGPHSQIMFWTMFGYAADSEEMTRHRLRQANLMGPAGFLGVDDNEAMKFVQEGLRRSPSDRAIVKLGGESAGETASIISESGVRAMYRYYRQVMEL